MWFSPPTIASLFLIPSVLAAVAPVARQEIPKDDETDKDSDPSASTTFNRQSVPPMTHIKGSKFESEIASGNWCVFRPLPFPLKRLTSVPNRLVEAFSPYCGHCKHLEPKWQTLYELYYTSDPVPASREPVDPQSSLNSFSRYYNFKFAKLDCVAFADACTDIGVSSFPTILMFKNGEEVKRSVGDKDMDKLSTFIEDSLETIRPGSRPQGGVVLPKAGAKGTGGLDGSDTPEEDGTPHLLPIDKSKTTATSSSPPKEKTVPDPAQKPALSSDKPNSDGSSQILTSSNFTDIVLKTLDPYFIKFYAPWCPHCQAMAPSWSSMAREMTGHLNVAEVNCETERKLCREMKASSYPTIRLYRGQESIEYEGLRGLGDLKHFAEQAVAAVNPVADVNLSEFEDLEKTEGAIFIYFYDHATTTEDFTALERLPLHLLNRAKIVKSKDEALARRFRISTWPRLLVSKSGKATVYPELMPQHMRDVPKMVEWAQQNWLPLVPEVDSANAQDVMAGKFVVLGILAREAGGFELAQRELKDAAVEWMDQQKRVLELELDKLRDAKQSKVEKAELSGKEQKIKDAKSIKINMDEIKRKEVAFAWADGVFWQRWIKTTFGIDVAEGQRAIVYDLDVGPNPNHDKPPPTATPSLELTPKLPSAEPAVLRHNPPKRPPHPKQASHPRHPPQGPHLQHPLQSHRHKTLPLPLPHPHRVHPAPSRLRQPDHRRLDRHLPRQKSEQAHTILQRFRRNIPAHGYQRRVLRVVGSERKGRLSIYREGW